MFSKGCFKTYISLPLIVRSILANVKKARNSNDGRFLFDPSHGKVNSNLNTTQVAELAIKTFENVIFTFYFRNI